MAVSNASNLPESRVQYWRRVLRPLSWWLLLVLVLYGIRLHQRWSAQTNLQFTSVVSGHASVQEVDAQLDGNPFFSGQRVRIGWHRLQLTHPDGYPAVTNLFVWYGERNLGKITLERTKGTLVINAEPKAGRLTIHGAEFFIVLTNGEGFNARVPTDQYTVEAAYKYWSDVKTVTVFTDSITSHRFAPKLGTLALTASHPDISFELRNDKNVDLEYGTLPVIIAGLPEGNGYRLHTDRKQDQRTTTLAVKAGATNEYRVEYVYGTATIESTPAGASVLKENKEIGVTPLTVSEVKPGPFDFTLRLNEYEPATGTFVVEANQTNSYRTNLISQYFTRAIMAARRHYQNMAYDRASEAAAEALKYKPGDIEAANLVTEASIQGHLAKAENLALRNDFTNAIAEANLALALAPDNPRGKEMVSDYTSREQQRLEAIRKREQELAEQARLQRAQELAEKQARRRTQELREIFNTTADAYENASQFSSHELVTTNPVAKVADNISEALSEGALAFDNAQLKWVESNVFVLEARQRLGVGYRDCLIVGSQIRDNEVQIRYKVFEYEHPPQVTLLGGLVQIKSEVNITSQDPQAAAAKAQRFQARVQSGINMVTARIQRAVAKS